MKKFIIILSVLFMFNNVYGQTNNFKPDDYGKKLLETYYVFKTYITKGSGNINLEESIVELQAYSYLLIGDLQIKMFDNKTILNKKLGKDLKELETFFNGCMMQPAEITPEKRLAATIWLRLWEKPIINIFMKLNAP